MSWRARWRSFDPQVVDAVGAVLLTVVGLITASAQDVHDDAGLLRDGYREPAAAMVATALVICLPVAVRRRAPLLALGVSTVGVLVHLLIGWPEGTLPLAALLLTFTVAMWCPLRQAIIGLALACGTILVLTIAGSPSLDAVGAVGTATQYAASWAIGLALHNRRAASDALVREADERAEAERQSTARMLAEERLRIAQELHDVVAHSMSVIAVQAGVGAHVLEARPDQARAALDAISDTSRGTLTELRRLLGVLRSSDGARSSLPAPGLADLPQLVDEVRSVGVPVELHVEAAPDRVHTGVELSAFRIVQEALTNVIKHAEAPTRVDVVVRHLPGCLAVEVVDDGAVPTGPRHLDGSGQGLIGMRERVELWGGELTVGPVPGGGYRVAAWLPSGDVG